MNVDQMLGINSADRTQCHADILVEADENLLDELVAFRKARGLTQAQVAEKLGVDQSAIARIESGERDPHLSTLRRYALAVGAVIGHSVSTFEDAAPTSSSHALIIDTVVMYEGSDHVTILGLNADTDWSTPGLKSGARWYSPRAGRR